MALHIAAKSTARSRQGYNIRGIEQKIIANYLSRMVPMFLVFFSIHNVGLKPLKYFCTEILQYPISIPKIQQVITKAGKNAKPKLDEYDKKAGEIVTAVEADTTWKGIFMKFLAIIDRASNYLFCLDPIKRENIDTIRPKLAKLARICCNLRLIVTDMALNFLSLIPQLFHGVIHLFCHNHMLKAVDRQLPEVRAGFLKAKIKLQKTRKPMGTVRKWLKRNRDRWYNTKSYEIKLRKDKKNQCKALQIPVKPNGAIKSPCHGLPESLKKISQRIYKLQANATRFLKQVQKQLTKQTKLNTKIKKGERNYYPKWSQYGRLRRIRNQFKNLLKFTDLRLFLRQERQLRKRIEKLPNKMTKKILEFLDLPQMRNFFKFSPEERKEWGSITTNHVEGFFAQMRVALDELRNAPDTPYIRARLDLLRYWHNFVGPLSGPNVGSSPVSRLGFHLTSTNPIRAICSNLTES